jgi:photosystem II protein
MQSYIEFLTNLKEKTLPLVKLTKSKDGTTATATFIFIYPSLFNEYSFHSKPLNGMFLIRENKKIVTDDITIFFKKGKPFLLKAVLIFKNSQEWFHFLNFMKSYSKETGLFFSEKNTSF